MAAASTGVAVSLLSFATIALIGRGERTSRGYMAEPPQTVAAPGAMAERGPEWDEGDRMPAVLVTEVDGGSMVQLELRFVSGSEADAGAPQPSEDAAPTDVEE